MVSEKFLINSDSGRMQAAKYVTENFAWYAHLSKKDTLRLCLLVEETLGMVKEMVQDYYGCLWFSGDEHGYEIHLEFTADMNFERKHELLSVSTSGSNASAKGFMARIGDFLGDAVYNFGKAMDTYGAETMRYGIINAAGVDMSSTYDMMPVWSLNQYRDALEDQREEVDEASEAWDELEKSIVANIADDVVVGVKGDRVELVITKALD